MRVIAYYTKDTPYAIEIKNLEKSLIDLGITYEFRGYTNRGAWERNCGIKPEFCLDMLRKYPGQVLVYIDADAVVRRPIVFVENFKDDFAVHYLGHRSVLSGTIVMRSTSRVIDLVKRWQGYQELNPMMWDQKTLGLVLREPQWHDIKLAILPSAYVKIFDNHKMDPNPVIEHFQASRRFKTLVGIKEDLPKGVRIGADGNLWLPRARPHLVTWLDSRYQRVPNAKNRWTPNTIGESDVCCGVLENKYGNQTGYIVGKGPSLDYVSREDFPETDSPIFCLNEAITVIQELVLPNPLYSVIDPPLKDQILVDSDSVALVNMDTGWYGHHTQRVTYSTRALQLTRSPLTAEVSIKILQKTGIKKIIFLAFDACIAGSLEYARSVGYPSTKGGAPERFKKHRHRFEGHLGETDHEFKLVHRIAISDTPQP